MPPLTLRFIQECLAEYMKLNGPDANSTEAANFIVEQRKAQRKKVNRVQVRQQNKSQTQRSFNTEADDAAEEKVRAEEDDNQGHKLAAFVL